MRRFSPAALRRATAALLGGWRRRGEERDVHYRSLFEQMTDAYALHEIVTDPQGRPCDYRFLEVNPSFERLTGLKREAVVGKRVLEILPATERDWIDTYGEVALTGKSLRIERYSREFGRYFSVVAFSPVRGQFATLFADVTERRHAEEELKRSRAVLERVFESIHVLIAYLDRDFNFIRVNRGYAAADNHDPDFFIGKNHFELYPNPENEAIFRQVVESGKPYIVSAKPFTYAEHPERGVTYWDWRLEPVKDADGRTEALILSLLDVTEPTRVREELRGLNAELQRTLAELRATQRQVLQSEKLSALGRLAAGVAHELNNPMMGVLNYIDYARRVSVEPRAREMLERASHELERMTALLKNMLTFARPVAVAPTAVQVSKVIDRALRLLEPEFKARGITVTTHIEEGLPAVLATEGHLQQVLVNLLMNARDAVEERLQRTVDVSALREEHHVAIAVSDSGLGIAAEIQEKIFDPFFTTKPAGKGTGLGLSISRNIITALGGRIDCRSAPGEGATFTLRLPAGQNGAPQGPSPLTPPGSRDRAP